MHALFACFVSAWTEADARVHPEQAATLHAYAASTCSGCARARVHANAASTCIWGHLRRSSCSGCKRTHAGLLHSCEGTNVNRTAHAHRAVQRACSHFPSTVFRQRMVLAVRRGTLLRCGARCMRMSGHACAEVVHHSAAAEWCTNSSTPLSCTHRGGRGLTLKPLCAPCPQAS
jgi:hypothetical protein